MHHFCTCEATKHQGQIDSSSQFSSPVDTDVTKYDPLRPLYSTSLEASEELPSSHTVRTLEERRRLSERLLSKGMCHMP